MEEVLDNILVRLSELEKKFDKVEQRDHINTNPLVLPDDLYLKAADSHIYFGASDDVNLYRYGANQLATDDTFFAYQYVCRYGDIILKTSTLSYPNVLESNWDATFGDHLHIRAPSEYNGAGILLTAGGLLYFGDSAGANFDVNLYRDSANTLKTDDTLVVGTWLYVIGNCVLSYLAGGGKRAIYVDNNGSIVV